MIVRIPLTEANSNLTPVIPPGTPPPPLPPDPWDGFSLPAIQTAFSPGTVPDYHDSRTSGPVVETRVTVPSVDLPTVNAWINSGGTSFDFPSETLGTRITEAVFDAVNCYFTDASRHTLFTRPFGICCALRREDGTHAAASTPVVAVPNADAPALILRHAHTTGDMLYARTEIRNFPQSLKVSLPAFRLPEGAEGIVAVDFAVTAQAEVFDGGERVLAVRSHALDGTVVPCWHYRRINESAILESVRLDNVFRTVASVPMPPASDGTTGLSLPQDIIDLNNWARMPRVNVTRSAPGPHETEEPEGPEPAGYELETGPLDLGYPECAKKVRGVALRGVFDRSRCRLVLEGSHHRDRWHTVAESRGAYIRLMRGMRFRWWRLKATLPHPASTDAIIFEIQ